MKRRSLVCKMPPTRVVHSDLIALSFKIYRFIRWNPIDETPSVCARSYFAFAVFYVVLCLIQELIYFVQHVGGKNSFLSLTNLAPCMGFVTLALVKTFTIYFNKESLKQIFKRLDSLCPNYVLVKRTERNLKTTKMMMKTLTFLYMALIWIFNLMPLFIIAYYFASDGSYRKQMPYFMWYPFDCLKPVVFEVCYAVVMWGALTCAIGILSTDLMLITIVALICLKFSILRCEIRRIIDEVLEREKLRKWIQDHNELMAIVDCVMKIFSVSLLIDFIGSSIIICLAGFQTIVSLNYLNYLNYLNFLNYLNSHSKFFKAWLRSV